MTREQVIEKLLSTNEYPNQEYINSIKEIIKHLENTDNKETLNYWKRELYIITGETEIKPFKSGFSVHFWNILGV